VDVERFGDMPEEPDTFGVPGPRDDPAGVLDRDGPDPPEFPDTDGGEDPRDDDPPDEEDDVGPRLPESPLTRGPDLPRSLPALRTLEAADWSEARAAWAVSRTFCPVVSVAAAARSAPLRAVLIASSALTIATWPKTPALWDDAPMFSFPPTPSRIWLPRLLKRLLMFSTPSASMLEPWPGATPPPPGRGVDPEPLEPLEPPLW